MCVELSLYIDDPSQRNACRYDSADPGSCRYGTECLFLHISSTSKPTSRHRFQTCRETPLTLKPHKKRPPFNPFNTYKAELPTADGNDGATALSSATWNEDVAQIDTALQPQASKNIEIYPDYGDSEDEVVYKGDNVGVPSIPTTRR